MTEVVAALIWKNNKFLICQRPANKSNALLWEFVGGKVEKDETKQQALIRECHEELDIKVEVKDEFIDIVHQYPDIKVHLTVFITEIASDEIKMLEHNDIRWITPSEISDFNFCPADKDILKKIIQCYS